MSRDEILKRGYVDVKVFVSGLRQSHRLKVVKEKTPHGLIAFLVAQHYIPGPQLANLAEQLQFPVKYKNSVAFPRGKMPKDFVEEGTEPEVTVTAETVEAEIED